MYRKLNDNSSQNTCAHFNDTLTNSIGNAAICKVLLFTVMHHIRAITPKIEKKKNENNQIFSYFNELGIK